MNLIRWLRRAGSRSSLTDGDFVRTLLWQDNFEFCVLQFGGDSFGDDLMAKVDRSLSSVERMMDADHQPSLTRLDIEVARIRRDPRHLHLIMVAAVRDLNLRVVAESSRPPSRDEQIIEKGVDRALEIVKCIKKA